MNLKDLLTTKETPPELFWALVIEKGFVQSGIWYIGEGTAKVIGIGAGIPWGSDEDLMEATDAALSSAIQKLPEDYPEPSKTVFGVSTSWVKDGEISPENLLKIKKLCTELSLTPVGFVVLPEAIAHLYKSEEGSPLNAIVLNTSSENLELSVFKLGELAGTTEVSRSVSLVDDVIEGLSRFEGISPLPTRFIVYDGKEGELDEAKQTLLQANWSDGKVSFLHTPQVEILSVDKKVLATALAGGAEMGDVKGVVNSGESEYEEAKEPQPEEIKEKPEDVRPVTAESLGFALEEDVSLTKNTDIQNVVPVQSTAPDIYPKTPPQQAGIIPNVQPPKEHVDYFAKSKQLFHSFSKMFSKPGVNSSGKNKGLIIALSVFGLVFLTIIGLWWFAQTAKVTIYVISQRAEENVQISFSTEGKFDQESNTFPVKVVTSEVSGEKTRSTTGTKLIGDKATGSVAIANGNSAAINLSAGTILTSSSGFKFVTSNEASVSGQLLPGSPGTATVNVTAYDIGSTYNLAKGEIFSVGNYSKSLVAATSLEDFSGGSSQQISAVGKEDQTELEEGLKTELAQNAKSELSAKTSENELFVNDLADLKTTKEVFDHDIGDQADNLKLSLSLKATGLVANREKIIEYAKNVLSDKAPAGYALTSDQVDFKFTFVEEKDGNYVYDAVVGGNFLPEVDTEKIKGTILGKSTNVATSYLNSIQGFDHADVTLKIKFPGFLKTIPRISKNITVEVKPD